MAPRKTAQQMVGVMVTVEEPFRKSLDTVAGHLESAGLSIAEKLPIGGVIVGEVAHSNLARLHTVKGIKAIEQEPTFIADR